MINDYTASVLREEMQIIINFLLNKYCADHEMSSAMRKPAFCMFARNKDADPSS